MTLPPVPDGVTETPQLTVTLDSSFWAVSLVVTTDTSTLPPVTAAGETERAQLSLVTMPSSFCRRRLGDAQLTLVTETFCRRRHREVTSVSSDTALQ